MMMIIIIILRTDDQSVQYTKECNITCSFDDASSSITVSNILSSTSKAKKSNYTVTKSNQGTPKNKDDCKIC